MAQGEHGRIIAAQAKAALAPLGFRRKGRSRVWLADRGFWLGVVEFQPSGFSRGSYLNVAAHWLWRPAPYSLSFDYICPQRPFVEFVSELQFEPLVAEQAKQAAAESDLLAQRFSTVKAVSSILVAEERARARDPLYADRPAGWPTFHAAIASGLASDTDVADEMLSAACESLGSRSPWLKAWLQSLRSGDFASLVRRTIDDARAHFQLPVRTDDLFE